MKKPTSTKPICKNCTNWKNKQAELEYNQFDGICTCHHWKFTTKENAQVTLLDRQNRSDKYKGVQRFENASNVIPFGQIEKSRYCLVTNENFGCVHFNK